MAPNFEPTLSIDPESNQKQFEKPPSGYNKMETSTGTYALEIFQASLNLLAHILIGATVGISYLFAFRSLPLGATPLHIVLCVTGYQLLMAQAILSLSNSNGWSSRLKLVHKRRAHWLLQLLGSGLAITGSFIKILDKTVHWNTLHGQFALVALVFTTVSLVNGLTSLYAYELRGKLSGNWSKLTHICFGTVAFVMASVSLCYGFDKGSFRGWATEPLAYTVMGFVGTFNLIIIVTPLITLYGKTKVVVKNIGM